MLLVVALPGVLAAGRAHAQPSFPRAMWLWSRADPVAVVDWASAHGVREIFAQVPWNVANSGDLPRLKQLKTRADAAGIKLSALGGDPGWTFDSASALTWQRGALGTGLFAGSHIDIEPYALSAWNSDRTATVQAFVKVMNDLQTDSPLPMEADVPFWYGTIPYETSTLADKMLSTSSAVTVMSYRDTATGPNSIMDIGTDMLTRAQAAGKRVRLAVETEALPDCTYCTFYEEGAAAMNAVMTTVDTQAASYANYAGLAVHHYDAWRRLT